MTELLSTYEPYFAAPRDLMPEERRTLLCVEDRPPEDETIEPDIQTAGAGNGLVYDLHFTLLASGLHVPMDQLTPLVLQAIAPTTTVIQHANVCGGEAAMPDAAAGIASHDPQKLIDAVNSFDLGVQPSTTEQMIELARRHQSQKSVPNIETAAAEMQDAQVSRVPVVGRHGGRAVIINNTRDRFRNRAAWAGGNPAYILSAAIIADMAGNILDATGASVEHFLAFSALRHIVTVEQKLRHPDPDQELSILVRNPSLARV